MKVRAGDILRALEAKHTRRKRPDKFFAEVCNGCAGSNRLDAVAIHPSWTRPKITGYEIKVSRQDFLADHKWPAYLEACHLFYFAAPLGLIVPDELDARVGLITYNPERGTLRTAKRAVFQDRKMDWKMLYSIVINRLEDDRYPFHNDDQAEFFRDWLAEKVDNHKLGVAVGTKMAQEIGRLDRENNRLLEELEGAERTVGKYRKLTAAVDDCFGVAPWGTNHETHLRNKVAASRAEVMEPVLIDAVDSVRLALEKLSMCLGSETKTKTEMMTRRGESEEKDNTKN